TWRSRSMTASRMFDTLPWWTMWGPRRACRRPVGSHSSAAGCHSAAAMMQPRHSLEGDFGNLAGTAYVLNDKAPNAHRQGFTEPRRGGGVSFRSPGAPSARMPRRSRLLAPVATAVVVIIVGLAFAAN